MVLPAFAILWLTHVPVALALKEQLLLPPKEVPVGTHDHPVDAIIVGDGRLIRPEPRE